jgi:hypothetical protein
MPEEKKPFDLKDLEAKLKEKGMPAVEGFAQAACDAVFEWLKESVELTPSKIDDLALVVIPPLKSYIDGKIAEISK